MAKQDKAESMNKKRKENSHSKTKVDTVHLTEKEDIVQDYESEAPDKTEDNSEALEQTDFIRHIKMFQNNIDKKALKDNRHKGNVDKTSQRNHKGKLDTYHNKHVYNEKNIIEDQDCNVTGIE